MVANTLNEQEERDRFLDDIHECSGDFQDNSAPCFIGGIILIIFRFPIGWENSQIITMTLERAKNTRMVNEWELKILQFQCKSTAAIISLQPVMIMQKNAYAAGNTGEDKKLINFVAAKWKKVTKDQLNYLPRIFLPHSSGTRGCCFSSA